MVHLPAIEKIIKDLKFVSAILPFDHPEAQTLGWSIPEKAASEFAHFVKGDKSADVSMEEYNGHTFQVSRLAAIFTYNKVVYNLKQFHMHTKSEHTLSGKQADFVHTTNEPAAEDKMLVVGVFFNAGVALPLFVNSWKLSQR